MLGGNLLTSHFKLLANISNFETVLELDFLPGARGGDNVFGGDLALLR